MINKVNFKFFVPYKQAEFKFNSGINIITGKNRSGKSQILEGISYGYFGRTKNSKISYIINPGASSATVDLDTSDFKLKRTRTEATSKLTGITKHELDTQLNLSYEEFLRMFYVSSSEVFTLFDPTYFRKFLINLFELEQYSKAYQKCNVEYKTLTQVEDSQVKINVELLNKRLSRLNKIVTGYTGKKMFLQARESTLRTCLHEVYKKQGIVEGKVSNFNKHKSLLEMSKCPKCMQELATDYKESIYTKLKELKPKLKALKEKLFKEQNELKEELTLKLKEISTLDERIYRTRILESTIKEKLNQKSSKRNTKRIKELEKILPILSPKGFPSHLLQRYIPVIQETANNLLHMIFNDIDINIRTVKPDGHTPDLKVMITMAGKTKQLKDYCGSETVLINLCLRLGVLVIYKQLNNTCIDFMLLDESMEKLDEEVSLKVIKLLKSFISMGQLKQIILVTHKKELKDLDNVNYIKLGE